LEFIIYSKNLDRTVVHACQTLTLRLCRGSFWTAWGFSEHQCLLFWLVTFPFHIIHAIVRIIAGRDLKKKKMSWGDISKPIVLSKVHTHKKQVHTHKKQVHNKVQNSQ